LYKLLFNTRLFKPFICTVVIIPPIIMSYRSYYRDRTFGTSGSSFRNSRSGTTGTGSIYSRANRDSLGTSSAARSKFSTGSSSIYGRSSLYSSAYARESTSSPATRRRLALTDHSSRNSASRTRGTRESNARGAVSAPYTRTRTDTSQRSRLSSDTSSSRKKLEKEKKKESSSGSSKSKSSKGMVCDKCDGNHETLQCPYYKKKRENHPDATNRKVKSLGKGGKRVIVRSGRVVRQPGDGSCLFHSLAYGLGGTSGRRLRSEICNYMKNHPDADIAGNPLKDWVKWDSNQSVSRYARGMSGGRWGGGIEMAVCAKMKDVNIHVYERRGWFSGGYERISCFENPGAKKTVSVLYCGGIHYDAFIP